MCEKMTDNSYTLTCPACETDHLNTEAPKVISPAGRPTRVCPVCNKRGPVELVYLMTKN